MINFKLIRNENFWSGSDWEITNEDELAILVAKVALGQHRHVENILKKTAPNYYKPSKTILKSAIQTLTANNPDEPWQRDGWVFQVISWIAANIQNPNSIKSPPHIRHADKGFDGIQIILNASNKRVKLVVVCEEKATGNPRSKVENQVWPDFQSIEQGKRDNELVSELTTLLSQNNHINPDKAVHEIIWKESRGYRVSITISDKESKPNGRNKLFKGYEKIIKGNNVGRRRAETMYQKDIRDWCVKFSKKAIKAAKKLEANNV